MSTHSNRSKPHKRSHRSKSETGHKSKIIPDVESWSDRSTVKCKTIGDRAAAFVWLSNHAAEYYESIDFKLNIAVIIIGYVLAIGGVPVLITTEDAQIIKICDGIIQSLIGLLATAKLIVLMYAFNKKISKHRWVSSAFSSLFLDIQKTLGQSVEQRDNFHSFYERIQEKEFDLKRKTPYIPPQIIKDYYKTLKARALDSAILFGDIQEIEIFIEKGKQFMTNRPPSSGAVASMVKHSQSARHKVYNDDLARSKLNLNSIPKQEPELESVRVEDPEESHSFGLYTNKAKKISELRRYELERYFIDD